MRSSMWQGLSMCLVLGVALATQDAWAGRCGRGGCGGYSYSYSYSSGCGPNGCYAPAYNGGPPAGGPPPAPNGAPAPSARIYRAPNGYVYSRPYSYRPTTTYYRAGQPVYTNSRTANGRAVQPAPQLGNGTRPPAALVEQGAPRQATRQPAPAQQATRLNPSSPAPELRPATPPAAPAPDDNDQGRAPPPATPQSKP
jgi:hypothetical protein